MPSSFYHGFDTLHVNWFTGCEPGLPCWARCWARAMANRLKGRYGYPADEPFRPTFHEEAFARPLPKKPQVVALNFMGEWALASTSEMTAILNAVNLYEQHTFLTLTKRPQMLMDLLGKLPKSGGLPDNLWLGLSASTQAELDERLPALLRIPAAHYWLSLEPLLGPVDLGTALDDNAIEDDGSLRPWIDWIVVGCESGRAARWGIWQPASMKVDQWQPWDVMKWTRTLVAQCHDAQVPVMGKQLPVFKDGKWVVSSTLADFPPDLQVAERPQGQKE